MSVYEQRRSEVALFTLGGSPAKSGAAWLSAIDKAERDGKPCPTWAELEEIAPSIETTRAPGPFVRQGQS